MKFEEFKQGQRVQFHIYKKKTSGTVQKVETKKVWIKWDSMSGAGEYTSTEDALNFMTVIAEQLVQPSTKVVG